MADNHNHLIYQDLFQSLNQLNPKTADAQKSGKQTKKTDEAVY